jgi:hypothetical protein
MRNETIGQVDGRAGESWVWRFLGEGVWVWVWFDGERAGRCAEARRQEARERESRQDTVVGWS